MVIFMPMRVCVLGRERVCQQLAFFLWLYHSQLTLAF